MERKLRFVWWFVLIGLLVIAIWRLFLPHGSNAYLQKTESSREIVVYVAGAVEAPGLVRLAPEARLDDALAKVRLLPEADLDNLNLAEKLKDGQKITIPSKPPLALEVKAGGGPAAAGAGSGSSGAAGSGSPQAGSGAAPAAGGKININTADAAELDKLPGVGPALAGRIIQYRTEHGPFTQPEDLEEVSGIGPKTYEKMATQITVNP